MRIVLENGHELIKIDDSLHCIFMDMDNPDDERYYIKVGNMLQGIYTLERAEQLCDDMVSAAARDVTPEEWWESVDEQELRDHLGIDDYADLANEEE